MTDRVDRLVVTLERDTRDDDVQCTVDAIEMIKGVAGVSTHVVEHQDHYARSRIRHELFERLFTVMKDVLMGPPSKDSD